MGCSASAPVVPDAVELARKESLGAGMAGATAIAAEVGAETALAVAAATGSALLDVAKVLPFVAPLALTIGAVAAACRSADRLEHDCRSFGVLVKEVEGCLTASESVLKDHEDTVEEIEDVLSRAAAFIKALQKTTRLARIASAGFGRGQLADARHELLELLAAINTSLSAKTAHLAELKFEEEAKLADYIEAKGGLGKILGEESLKEELEDLMTNTDKLVLALAEDAKAHRQEMLDKLTSKLDEQTEVIARSEEQQKLLTIQNKILSDQVAQMNKMLEAQAMQFSEFMARFPLPPSEPKRLLTIQELGLQFLNRRVPAVESYMEQVYKRPEIVKHVANINCSVVDKDVTLYFHCGIQRWAGMGKDGAFEHVKGALKTARVAGPCQYSVAEGKVICRDTSIASMGWFQDLAPDLASVCPAVSEHLETMSGLAEGGPVERLMKGELTPGDLYEDADEKGYDGALVQVLTLEQMGRARVTYTGHPIKISGQSVGAACVLIHIPDGIEEKDFDPKPTLEELGITEVIDSVGKLLHEYASSEEHQAYVKKRNAEEKAGGSAARGGCSGLSG